MVSGVTPTTSPRTGRVKPRAVRARRRRRDPTASMSPSSRPVLRVRGVHKRFAAAGGTTVALNGVDLDIEAGSFVSIIGPSGCGKSTLLQIMAGLASPTSGEVFCGDNRVQGPPPDVLYVFQQYTRSLFPWKTVHRNVTFGLENKGTMSHDAHAERQPLGAASGGQGKRAGAEVVRRARERCERRRAFVDVGDRGSIELPANREGDDRGAHRGWDFVKQLKRRHGEGNAPRVQGPEQEE